MLFRSVQNHYSLKALMRTILQSETWQRSSEPLPENSGDQRQYSRCFPRRMLAEVMLDAVSQVTDVPTEFKNIVYSGSDIKPTDAYPRGTRAIQLQDSAVQSWFLQTFGRNQRRITCECERSDEPSMVQALHLSNGDTLNGKLSAPENRLSKWLAANMTNEEIISEIYLSCLARQPSAAEQAGLLAELQRASTPEERRATLEDVLWAVLSSREFLFNH